jgi:ABC-type Fe3+ transport system permease subunit
LLEAAADLGASPWQAFLRVTLPLSMPGIIAGALLVFIPAVGEFVIPDILGGPDALTIGRVLWTEFFTNRDWPLAAAVAVAMLLLLVIPTLVFEYVENRRERREAQRMNRRNWGLWAVMALGYALPVRADPLDGGVFVQRLADGHGLGRLLHPLVRVAVRPTNRSWRHWHAA